MEVSAALQPPCLPATPHGNGTRGEDAQQRSAIAHAAAARAARAAAHPLRGQRTGGRAHPRSP
eukprot:scaffold38118_cov32-Tisochrysis_lutea.AAC.9